MHYLFKALLIGIITGIVGILLGLSPIGASLERNVGLNLLFNLRGETPAPNDVAIVAIDNRTGEQLGLPSLPREWPRSIHATLVDKLVERGAAVIVFDIHFHRSKSAQPDQQLVDAVAKANRVILVEQVNGKRQPILDAEGKIVGAVWTEELLQPFPELARAARGLATFTLPKTEATVFGFWVFKESIGQAVTMPAIALHLASTLQSQVKTNGTQASSAKQTQPNLTAGEQVTQADLLSSTTKLLRSYYTDQNNIDNAEPNPAIIPIPSALKHMYQGPAYRYLNFYGPPGTITTIPYHAVINGSDPNVSDQQLDVRGKVVFVGYSDLFDPGQPDRFYTVFSNEHGVDLSGVEIAATAFTNLYNEQSLTLPSGFVTPALLFLFGVIAGLIAYLLPAVYGVPIILAIAGGYVYFVYLAFTDELYWLPLTTPILIELPIAIFLGLFGQYYLQRKRSEHISEALNYYLPEAAARELTTKSADPDSFNKVVYSTCLATDMAGFSTIAEQLPPGELAVMLNDYFDTLAAPLKRHGVNITEFRADAIMCAWTADQSIDDIRKKPLLAALEAAQAMQDFKHRHETFKSDLRVGLESGNVYIGHAGGGGHFVFSIVGDCANTASRIEGLNKHIGTQILATKLVVEGLDGILTRYLGDFLFVNKTEETSVYEIISTLETASSDQLKLCENFSVALQYFQKGEWDNATHLLTNLNKDYPEDGPTQFLLTRTQQYQEKIRLPINPRIIRMNEK